MASIKCARCDGMLVKDIEHGDGEAREVIKCIMCGNRVASRPLRRQQEDSMEKHSVLDIDRQADAAGLPPDAAAAKVPKHTTGPKPVKEKPKYKGKKQIKPCARCEKEMPVVSRGLCGRCYHIVKNQGKLDELYPAIRRAKKQAKPDAEKQKCETPGRMPLQLGKSHIITVPLHFNLDEPRDADLHRRLVEAADVDRRTMPAEIMTLLETVTSDE